MIIDICRIIKKGKSTDLINFKIKEFHKLEADYQNKEILKKYKAIDPEENLDEKQELENNHPWLLEVMKMDLLIFLIVL
ncbi:MAG: hypothetical protein JKY89_03705 [Immundisolibacteraceae bacterium]|nr:hypothetical protein [Immundisolibacteraceae bacterium]